MKVTDEMLTAFRVAFDAETTRNHALNYNGSIRAGLEAAIAAATANAAAPDRVFKNGDRVAKHSGSWWEGRVVGFYSTEQTLVGYCVQLDGVENGPVQIYPESALYLTPDN